MLGTAWSLRTKYFLVYEPYYVSYMGTRECCGAVIRSVHKEGVVKHKQEQALIEGKEGGQDPKQTVVGSDHGDIMVLKSFFLSRRSQSNQHFANSFAIPSKDPLYPQI